jgi:hypothetical protein
MVFCTAANVAGYRKNALCVSCDLDECNIANALIERGCCLNECMGMLPLSEGREPAFAAPAVHSRTPSGETGHHPDSHYACVIM